MFGSDLPVAALAVACFYALWWDYSLSRRLRGVESQSKLDPLTGGGAPSDSRSLRTSSRSSGELAASVVR